MLREAILSRLASSGPLTLRELADEMGLGAAAHAAIGADLRVLAQHALVAVAERQSNDRGRVAVQWRLTEAGQQTVDTRYADTW